MARGDGRRHPSVRSPGSRARRRGRATRSAARRCRRAPAWRCAGRALEARARRVSSRPCALPRTSSTSSQNSRNLTAHSLPPSPGVRGCRCGPTQWPGGARALLRPDQVLVHGRVRRAHDRAARRLDRRSPAGSTRSSSPPPVPARRSPRSSGRSTASSPGSAPTTPSSAAASLYVSPLKALATDVERNLRSPLVGHPAGGDPAGPGAPRRHGGHPHGRHTARTSAGPSRRSRPTSSSRPPSRSTWS